MTTPTTPPLASRHRLLGDHSWQEDAVCQPTDYNPVDPEWFFPEPEETDKIRTAKALCAQCPVRRTCLDVALETGDVYGIRGGLTEEERGPLHEQADRRLDHSRVTAALAGRDIHLTKAERRALVATACQQGISEERLARLLKISEEHAQKLYRKTRRVKRHRMAKAAPKARRPGDERPARGDFGAAA
ncbi:WhiB family transcriptional regulator [Streptomyces sp. HPF1205]|uniref:WhiB family transcriptional regulator n=1 Tax=Streptomyces sp. HPF1205 TaxID=2873262 RepID=UPI001CECF38F|nr:WhiB family transcriptional regulator [Streptomyces sp. HPF1205]